MHKQGKNCNSESKFYDPRISRIKKIFAKIIPKSLDLYARIYGNFYISLDRFVDCIETVQPSNSPTKVYTKQIQNFSLNPFNLNHF